MIKREYFFCLQVKPFSRKRYEEEKAYTMYSGIITHKSLLPVSTSIITDGINVMLEESYLDFSANDFLLTSFNRVK